MASGSRETRPIQVWRGAAVERLEYLRRLPTGWDGYGGRPVEAENARRALEILDGVCDARTPVPSIVPGPAGDLQIEWHTKTWDIEVEIDGSDRIAVWRGRVAATDDGETLSIDGNLAALRAWIRAIAEPMRAAPAA